MSQGIKEEIQKYLSGQEVETRMLLVIYYDEDNIYRFISNDNASSPEAELEGTTINGEVYYNASISRGDRAESSDSSIESLEIKLSNKWQRWAAILANQGNQFNNKKAEIYEWFPDFPDDEPVLLYRGILDKISMTVTDFSATLIRTLGDYDEESPNMTFDPNCQFVFKDERCKYSGSEHIECGKTLTDCINRNNVENFGGHPSVPRELVIKG